MEHVGIGVKDLEKSIAFYRDVLGYQIAQERVIDTPTVKKLVFMKRGNDMVELLYMPDAPAPEPRRDTVGLAHLCFVVEDLDAEVARWLGMGVEQTLKPVPAGEHERRTVFKGPNGEQFELRG